MRSVAPGAMRGNGGMEIDVRPKNVVNFNKQRSTGQGKEVHDSCWKRLVLRFSDTRKET